MMRWSLMAQRSTRNGAGSKRHEMAKVVIDTSYEIMVIILTSSVQTVFIQFDNNVFMTKNL